MAIEKRKYERVSPPENTFAALGRQYAKVGRIKDISLGGLAFEYISEVGTDRDYSCIDIFLIGDVFQLYNIPCEIVYDIPLPVLLEDMDSIKFSPTKRCGVQFGAMTEDDMAYMKLFLEVHTKSSVL